VTAVDEAAHPSEHCRPDPVRADRNAPRSEAQTPRPHAHRHTEKHIPRTLHATLAAPVRLPNFAECERGDVCDTSYERRSTERRTCRFVTASRRRWTASHHGKPSPRCAHRRQVGRPSGKSSRAHRHDRVACRSRGLSSPTTSALVRGPEDARAIARVAGAVARPGSHRTVRTLFVYGSSGRRVMTPAAGRLIDLESSP